MPRCSAISFHMLSVTTGAQAHLDKRPIRSTPRTGGVECLSCVAPEACSVLSGGCTFPRLYDVHERMYASHVAFAYEDKIKHVAMRIQKPGGVCCCKGKGLALLGPCAARAGAASELLGSAVLQHLELAMVPSACSREQCIRHTDVYGEVSDKVVHPGICGDLISKKLSRNAGKVTQQPQLRKVPCRNKKAEMTPSEDNATGVRCAHLLAHIMCYTLTG